MMRLFVRSVLALVVVIGAAAALAAVGWNRMREPFKGFQEPERFVDIPTGASGSEIRRRLIDAGIVRDEVAFRAAVWWTGAGRGLQAGEYRFDRPMSALEVVEKLDRGDVYARRLTLPEGLTIREMATIVEAQGFGAAAEFIKVAGNEALIADLDPRATDLEGYLFPDTYALPRDIPVTRIVAGMVQRFRAKYDETLQQRAAAQQLTTRAVVTLASLVEKETGREEERPLVAAVYRNRLRLDMPMQADPTVIYALTRAGKYDGNIRRQDLEFKSPYNTYVHAGLPPGPIASPGRASLDAALAPAAVRYLYFVSRNDGSHVFAETLKEHNANVQEFQVSYFRSQRSRGKGQR